MQVCHIVPSLEERHGGPSRSVRALSDAQVELGASVNLLATGSASSAISLSGKASVRLFQRQFPQALYRSVPLRDHLLATRYGCVHHHALWLLTLHYADLSARRHHVPLVISPRGMLTPWAYGHHQFRKRLASMFVHPGAFRMTRGWHATSQAEADDIRRLGFRQPICVSPNGVVIPESANMTRAREAWFSAFPALRKRRIAVFYSRFHRKKRVRELIELWGAASRGDWMLLVAGIPEEFNAAELQQEAALTTCANSILIADSTGMPAPYPVAELFLLPSHSENFGLVIAEAMAAGLPALVTDGTPWQQLDDRHSGRCTSWEEYPRALAAFLAMPQEELAVMGRQARSLVSSDFTWARGASLLLDFYEHITNG